MFYIYSLFNLIFSISMCLVKVSEFPSSTAKRGTNIDHKNTALKITRTCNIFWRMKMTFKHGNHPWWLQLDEMRFQVTLTRTIRTWFRKDKFSLRIKIFLNWPLELMLWQWRGWWEGLDIFVFFFYLPRKWTINCWQMDEPIEWSFWFVGM